jgi:hypothetical protein
MAIIFLGPGWTGNECVRRFGRAFAIRGVRTLGLAALGSFAITGVRTLGLAAWVGSFAITGVKMPV